MDSVSATGSKRGSQYALKRALKREKELVNLESRVKRPVRERGQDPVTKTGFAGSAKGGIYLTAALFVHGTIFGAFSFFGSEFAASEPKEVSKAVFTVEKEPPSREEIKEPEREKIKEPEQEEPPPWEVKKPNKEPEKERPTLKRKTKRLRNRLPSRGKMLSADPVNISEKEAKSPERRRIVGISLSSTVKGKGGPAFATGNTRMGTTAKVAESKGAKELGVQDVRPSAGVEVSSNRKAAFLPAAAETFEKPKRLSKVNLDYPAELKQRGIEGNVLVLIVIDKDGRVKRVRILNSSGYVEFDRAAKEAALKEYYRPAKKNGEPVEYNLRYTYRFRITGA